MLEGTQSNNDHLVGFSSYTMPKGMLRPQYQSRAITTHRVAQHGGQTGLLWWNSGTLFPVGFYAGSRMNETRSYVPGITSHPTAYLQSLLPCVSGKFTPN